MPAGRTTSCDSIRFLEFHSSAYGPLLWVVGAAACQYLGKVTWAELAGRDRNCMVQVVQVQYRGSSLLCLFPNAWQEHRKSGALEFEK